MLSSKAAQCMTNPATRLALALAAAVSACGGAQQATPHDGAHGHGRHGHDPLVHRFEHADEWAPRFDDPARDGWQQPAEVIAVMELEAGMTVADIGAGTGYFEPWLSRAVGPAGTVLALDIEPDMVRYLRERSAREGLANVRAQLAGVDDPGLAPAGVDRVLIVDTWHHIAAREEYAAKLRDALKPGGRIFVVDFTREAKHGPPPAHRLAPEAVVRELAAAGLRAEVRATKLTEQYVVVATNP